MLNKIQDAYYIEMDIQNKGRVSFSNTQIKDNDRKFRREDILIPMKLVGGANV